MHLHIGDRKTVSFRKIVGVFNAETMRLSEDNSRIIGLISPGDKCVAVDIQNNLHTSRVSSFTVIKRDSLTDEVIWRKK